jgi:hypothetical protein
MKRYDVIANPQALDAAENGAEGATMTLDVVRDGEAMTLSFAPWSPPSPGKQWVRTGVPEDQCNL